MQRRIQQTDCNRSFFHCFVDAFEVFLLERSDAFQCSFSFFYCIRHDHFSEFHDSVSFEEHMLCSCQTDTFCTEVDSNLCIVRCICVCSYFQASLCICPFHECFEVACDLCFYCRDIFAIDVTCGTIQGDVVAFFECLTSQCECFCFFIHFDFFTTRYAACTHTTGYYCSVGCHTATYCQDTLRCSHTFDIFGRGFQTNQDNSVACFCSCFCFFCCEVYFTSSSTGGCGQTFADGFCRFQCSLVECRVQQLIQLFGFYSHQCFVCCDQTLFYHFNGDSQSSVSCSLTVSCLQEEQFTFFDSKFHILHIFIVIFQFISNFHELVIYAGHIFCQFCDGVRCTYTSYYVFALCIYQVFTQHCFFASCSVSCKGYASTGCITHVTEYHHLNVYCCTPAVRDVVHSSVNECTRVIPAAEYCHCCFQQLFFRILREFFALVIQIDLFEDGCYFFQVFCSQICVVFCTNFFFIFIQSSFEFGFGYADNYVCEHHDKSSVGVVSESGVVCFLSQTFNRNIVQTQIQNSIHHTGHGCSCTGTYGNQQGIFGITQFFASQFFQITQSHFDLCDHFVCQFFAAFVVFCTSFCGDCEAVGNGQTQICHFSQVCTFAAKQVFHGSVTFAEHINVFFAHVTLPPVNILDVNRLCVCISVFASQSHYVGGISSPRPPDKLT